MDEQDSCKWEQQATQTDNNPGDVWITADKKLWLQLYLHLPTFK